MSNFRGSCQSGSLLFFAVPFPRFADAVGAFDHQLVLEAAARGEEVADGRDEREDGGPMENDDIPRHLEIEIRQPARHAEGDEAREGGEAHLQDADLERDKREDGHREQDAQQDAEIRLMESEIGHMMQTVRRRDSKGVTEEQDEQEGGGDRQI